MIFSAQFIDTKTLIANIVFSHSQGPCPAGAYACDGGQKCVLQRGICDGRRECDDGLDEDAVECGRLYSLFPPKKRFSKHNPT